MSRRHEQLLFRYSSALERGEFEIVAEVLREAEHDPALERAILEMNDVYAAERVGSTNHVNHREKEVPMTVAFYRRRQSTPVRWQSLPLVAALAVIAVLTLLLAAQIRSNSNNAAWGTGNRDGSDAPALAQGGALCDLTLLKETNVHNRDSYSGTIIGTIPAGTWVRALEVSFRVVDPEAGVESMETWLFVVAEGAGRLQGWILADAQEIKNCPAASVGDAAAATPTVFSMTATPLPSLTPTAAGAIEALPTFTLVPFSAATRATEGVAQYTFATACMAVTRATTDVLSEPSWDGQVLVSVPRGTDVRVSDYAVSTDAQGRQEAWYFGAMNDGTGWMLASLLDALACPPVPNMTALVGTVPPSFTIAPMQLATVVPADVQPIDPALGTALPPTVAPPNFALPTFTPSPAPFTLEQATVAPEVHAITLPPTVEMAGMLPVQATPQYYVYVVQPGDTLLSILARFGLDRSALPDVLRANNLTEDSVIAPGITLYVPTSQQLITLACKITAARTLDLHVRPEMDAPEIGSLPIGAEFELIDRSEQRDGVWYAIAAQVEGVTVRGAWVSPGAITVPTDCQQSVPGAVITVLPPTSTPLLTPTLGG
jgi:LysM repeat protein